MHVNVKGAPSGGLLRLSTDGENAKQTQFTSKIIDCGLLQDRNV